MASAALVHDTFNIFCIGMLNILNLLNWHLDIAHWADAQLTDDGATWGARWSGEYQNIYLAATYAYSILDTLVIIAVPKCVGRHGELKFVGPGWCLCNTRGSFL